MGLTWASTNKLEEEKRRGSNNLAFTNTVKILGCFRQGVIIEAVLAFPCAFQFGSQQFNCVPIGGNGHRIEPIPSIVVTLKARLRLATLVLAGCGVGQALKLVDLSICVIKISVVAGSPTATTLEIIYPDFFYF